MNDFRELVDVEMESTDTTSTPVVSPLPIAAHRLMLRKGDRGESVKEMQRGIGGLTADGLFGPATDRRVRAWQKENGLVPDGLFGPKDRKSVVWGKSVSVRVARGGRRRFKTKRKRANSRLLTRNK